MRRIRRTAALLLAVMTLLSGCVTAPAAQKTGAYQVDEANNDTFVDLLDQLKAAYEKPSGEDTEKIDALVETISTVSADDGDIARAIAEH